MKRFLFVVVTFFSLATAGWSAAPVPESPAIWREVTGVTNAYPGAIPTQTGPHVPSFRTSSDGRIGLRVKGSGEIALMMPEKLTQPVRLSPPGSYVMSSTSYKFLDGFTNPNRNVTNFYSVAPGTIGAMPHLCLFDPTSAMSSPGEVTNPTNNAAGEDVYELKVLGIFNYDVTDTNHSNQMQLFVTPVQVIVTNPKTTNASIRSYTKTGPSIAGPIFNHLAEGHEPVIVGDGRLLVLRMGAKPLPWKDPVTGAWQTPTQSVDIVYSYYTGSTPCDVTQWSALIPITHAPYDSRINLQFGFAMAPFRDPEGTIIPDGEDIGGTYPWMDRQARNLFFTSVADTLHYAVGTNWTHSRYPQTGTPEEPPVYLEEDGGNTRGICFVGLWSHGKVVMIDNLNNDMDYAVGNASFPIGSERMVTLFQTNSGPLGNETGLLRLGAGRANAGTMPDGDNQNSTILDSLENIFNYNTNVFPMTLRDVVWPLHNAKHSDDLAFDDFLDPDGFIVANMAGLAVFDTNATHQTSVNKFIYYSGWNPSTHAFDQPVMFQNAATAPTNRWVVPTHGLLVGNGRLEPAAAGGVHGKGFWLTSSNGIEFPVVAQPQSVASKDWYVGLFVDCRFNNDTNMRVLLQFPDASSIWLYGRSQVIYADANGTILNRITVPPVSTNAPASALDDLLPDTAWAHLAFQIRGGGTQVDFYLDGIIYNRWQDNYSSLFQITNEFLSPPWELTVGLPAGSSGVLGFTGWVDDLKVLAHTVDFETACNQAGGTLIGLPSTYTNLWKSKFSDRYPAWAQGLISNALQNNGKTNYPAYANFHDYTRDYGAYRGNLPAGTVALGQSIHFPEGPLFYNAPRPHSLGNSFCLTCHTSTGSEGLDLTALTINPTVTASQDERRQPFQPFRRVFGHIPPGLVNGTGLPTAATNLPPAGQVIDQWNMPSFGSATAVQSYTLVNADTKLDLLVMTNGLLVDPARLGTTNFALRANLDSAQGSVTLKFDSNPSITVSNPPYALFGPAGNPYLGTNFTAGAHTLKATPSFGSLNTLSFSAVTNGTSRIVAGLQTDFTPFSPTPGWTFEWNAVGTISNAANFRYLSWSPTNDKYTADGSTNFPVSSSYLNYGGFRPGGGNPGRGAAAGGGFDRFAIAGYQAKLAGNYSITNSFLTDTTSAGDGGELMVWTYTNGGASFTKLLDQLYDPGTTIHFDLPLGALQAGDIVYVAIGPRGNDSSDLFNLDFNILFH